MYSLIHCQWLKAQQMSVSSGTAELLLCRRSLDCSNGTNPQPFPFLCLLPFLRADRTSWETPCSGIAALRTCNFSIKIPGTVPLFTLFCCWKQLFKIWFSLQSISASLQCTPVLMHCWNWNRWMGNKRGRKESQVMLRSDGPFTSTTERCQITFSRKVRVDTNFNNKCKCSFQTLLIFLMGSRSSVHFEAHD